VPHQIEQAAADRLGRCRRPGRDTGCSEQSDADQTLGRIVAEAITNAREAGRVERFGPATGAPAVRFLDGADAGGDPEAAGARVCGIGQDHRLWHLQGREHPSADLNRVDQSTLAPERLQECALGRERQVAGAERPSQVEAAGGPSIEVPGTSVAAVDAVQRSSSGERPAGEAAEIRWRWPERAQGRLPAQRGGRDAGGLERRFEVPPSADPGNRGLAVEVHAGRGEPGRNRPTGRLRFGKDAQDGWNGRVWSPGFVELEERDQRLAVFGGKREQPVALDEVVNCLPAADAQQLLSLAHVQ